MGVRVRMAILQLLLLVSAASCRTLTGVNKESSGNFSSSTLDRVNRLLTDFPVIDGHNDFAMGVRRLPRNDVSKLNFDEDLTQQEPWASYWANHVDLPRMKKGKMGGQFWSAYMGCGTQFKDAVQLFLEQIDVIRQFVAKYPDDLKFATSVADIEAAWAEGKIASLIGVESGHAIGSSLSILRTLYNMGARYMTLTHTCNTPWADAAQVEQGYFPPRTNGISEFGEKVVLEMNRLGMLVDLSHVSSDAMRQVLNVTRAPVIFSHSGARSVCSHPRNVPDDVLEKVAEVGGVVMVNFYSCFLTDNCTTEDATVLDVVKHINHIRRVAGVNHVGIGGDYNGIDRVPVGLEDVSKYPEVFAALIEDGEFEWTDEELAKVSGLNLINTFRAVEEVRDTIAELGELADNSWIPKTDLGNDTSCNTDFPAK